MRTQGFVQLGLAQSSCNPYWRPWPVLSCRLFLHPSCLRPGCAMQGFMQLGLGAEQLRTLLAAVACQAAQRSLVVGELPPMPHNAALDLLAEAGDPFL